MGHPDGNLRGVQIREAQAVPVPPKEDLREDQGHRNKEGFTEREGCRRDMHEGALPLEGTQGEGLSSQEVTPWNGE